ncbi:hypothetical protein J6590_014670 [Homalodisca vitripennis]|nr:hypothetical protein J6590_014670 [Homalodisca vitripennis]
MLIPLQYCYQSFRISYINPSNHDTISLSFKTILFMSYTVNAITYVKFFGSAKTVLIFQFVTQEIIMPKLALRGAAVVISLRRLHSEERSRCWDQSPQTAQRVVAPGVDIGTLSDYCLEDVSTAGREEKKKSQGEERRETRQRGKTTCWMIDTNHATTSREKERPAL